MNKKPKAIFFDLFDTLVYLKKKRLKQKHLNIFNLTLEDKKKIYRIISTKKVNSLREIVNEINKEISKTIRLPEIILKIINLRIKNDIKNSNLFPETIEVLEKLKEKNIKLGLISNLPVFYKEVFFKFGLDKFFDEIIFSYEVGIAKPNKEIFTMMCNKFNLKPHEVIFIGDNYKNDIKVPKELGFKTLQIKRKNKIHSKEEINSLNEIIKFI